jgi:hypothetical protein
MLWCPGGSVLWFAPLGSPAVNAERLHAIVDSLRGEVDETLVHMRELGEVIRRSANNPGDADIQRAVVESREQLYKMLERASSETLSPAGRDALKELKVADLLGTRLRKRIDDIFKQSSITPATAADDIDGLVTQIQKLSELLASLRRGFESLGIGIEELEPGEVEVSFLIPRREVHDGLEELGREFINIKRILGPFLELSTGSREDVRVRAIASSEFEAYLLLGAIVAANFAKALETVLNIYEKLLNIRKASKQLEETGIDPQYVDGLQERANDMTRQEIEDFVARLLNERGSADDLERDNELRTDLTKQTMELARRIDRGYRVDLEARELPPAEDTTEPTNRTEQRAAVNDVLAVRQRLRAFKLTGKPILGLPETTDQAGDPEANVQADD